VNRTKWVGSSSNTAVPCISSNLPQERENIRRSCFSLTKHIRLADFAYIRVSAFMQPVLFEIYFAFMVYCARSWLDFSYGSQYMYHVFVSQLQSNQEVTFVMIHYWCGDNKRYFVVTVSPYPDFFSMDGEVQRCMFEVPTKRKGLRPSRTLLMRTCP
jgi:hypothetical protein